MVRAIIIDDEQHCTDRLKSLLETGYKNSISLIGEFDSVESGYRGIEELNPDLVFLDVQIREKIGFDLLRELGTVDFEVIFTTAFDTFAVRAFKFSALDYLLKPIDRDDLDEAINKFMQRNKKEKTINRLDVLIGNTTAKGGFPKRIIVPTSSGFEVFDIDEILRFQSDINYTTIFLKNKQKLVVAKTLKDFEEMLTDQGFFRIHNSHLVNLSCIKSYNKGKGGSVILRDGTELEVSTRRKDEFLRRLAAG